MHTEYYSYHQSVSDSNPIELLGGESAKALNRKNISYVAELMGYGWGILNIFKYTVEKARESSDSVIFEKLESTAHLLDSTKVLATINFLTYIPLLVKSVKKTITKSGVRRIDNGLLVTFCIRSMLAHFKSAILALDTFQVSAMLANVGLKPAFDIVIMSTQYIAVVNFVLSPVNLALNIRNCYKTDRFLKGFKERSSNLTLKNKNLQEDYQNFIKGLGSLNACSLSKHFGANGEALKVKLIALKNINDQKQMIEVVNTLEGRLNLTIRNYKAAMVADAISIVAAGIFVASFAGPAGYILSAAALSITIGIMVTRKVSTYQFENKMGLLEREKNSPFYNHSLWPNPVENERSKNRIGTVKTIRDFTRWLFMRHRYYLYSARELEIKHNKSNYKCPPYFMNSRLTNSA